MSSSVISLHSTLFKHWSIWKFFWRRWTDPNYVNFLNVSVYKVETVWVIVIDNLMHIGLYFLVSRGLILSLSQALPEPAEVKLLCYFVRKVVGVTVFVSDSLFWCWLGSSKNDKKLTSPDLDANIYYSFSKVAL